MQRGAGAGCVLTVSQPCPGFRPVKLAVLWLCRKAARPGPATRRRPQWLRSTRAIPFWAASRAS